MLNKLLDITIDVDTTHASMPGHFASVYFWVSICRNNFIGIEQKAQTLQSGSMKFWRFPKTGMQVDSFSTLALVEVRYQTR